MKLVIGNKNYSSWSFRPWIGLKAAGIAFDEDVVSLYVEGGREQILKHSPAGKVPILIDGDVRVWESLAILEYAADKFPAANLWPSDPAARARSTGQGGRSCLAHLRRPTRCMRRWCSGSSPTTSM